MTAKPLMVQGTMSGVGKSLLVAGLCRVLAQDGYRVAPFKSQNMALNSAVTAEGLEIGRAQAMQAEAAGIDPTAAMNPVLLKPTTDTGSQVIVDGRPIGTMPAREYFAFRHKLRKHIQAAYQRLTAEYDMVLIEGAGSPVELNLLRDDIVNMGVAKMCASPVLLVGDIDKGGVFAQLIGTMMLLPDDERSMVKASVVNKFRGDSSLFDEGVAILRERMGVPVAGVVPYLQVDLDDEDSVSSRLAVRQRTSAVDVAVIRLPKISNFTDFIALDVCEGMGVRYVSSPDELGRPDLLIVPGSKATIADLLWMRERGLEDVVQKAVRSGVPVLGICGGYQMLGLSIADPLGMEGGGEVAGMGLLPVRTVFGKDKHQVRTTAQFCDVQGALAPLSGAQAYGYEIHMGITTLEGGAPLLKTVDSAGSVRNDGCQCGSVYGCYLHGLFDSAEVAQALLAGLLEAKGIEISGGQSPHAQDMRAYRQAQYDALADGLRASLDMNLVYHIIEKGLR